eukprot:gnl/MRDRNA2_/MRDRNA2_149275_c0_seq1.p1 gnl/MRDRNA2_/MRDRNA2_149275_c0~~gnl/MRDRNA2_/MRDRNA2_149275_c0_seq1.p1  ORF type:complete len:430 (-),score=74.09 gnl/MRDRNA2_/MRDRNA2_149275_c0_seq1:440-1552(-)
MAIDLAINLVIIPFIIGLIIAHILTQATAHRKDGSDEPTAYHLILQQSPQLCDFSHEHHKSIGHFGRRKLKHGLRGRTSAMTHVTHGVQGADAEESYEDQTNEALPDADGSAGEHNENHVAMECGKDASVAEKESDVEAMKEEERKTEADKAKDGTVFFPEDGGSHQEHQHLKRFKMYSLTVKFQTKLNGVQFQSLSFEDKNALREHLRVALCHEIKAPADKITVNLSAGSIQIDVCVDYQVEGKQQSALLIADVTKMLEAPHVKEKILEAARQVKPVADLGDVVYLTPIEVEVEAHRAKTKPVEKLDETKEAKLSKTDKVVWPCCPRPDNHTNEKIQPAKETESAVRPTGVNLNVKCCNVQNLGLAFRS